MAIRFAPYTPKRGSWFGLPVLGDHDVGGLQITLRDPFGMRLRQRSRNLAASTYVRTQQRIGVILLISFRYRRSFL